MAMAIFTENMFILRLQELNSSQQNIRTLSLWLLHHKQHHVVVVKTWFQEIMKVSDNKQLSFMHLANDILQTSSNEGPEYSQEFEKVLMETFKHIVATGIDADTKLTLHSMLTVWEKRGIYDPQKINEFKEALGPDDGNVNMVTKRKSEDVEDGNEMAKKMKIEQAACSRCSETIDHNNDPSKILEVLRELKEVQVEEDDLTESAGLSPQLLLLLRSMLPNPQACDPEDLLRALIELDEINSSDEMIANSSPEVEAEVELLNKMPPYHRINFIINLLHKMCLQKKLERALEINAQKLDRLRRIHKMLQQ